MAGILIIDDEEDIRGLYRRILEQHGHRVTEACDGNEGTRLYRQLRHDIIITDIIMPEKDGLETIMDLRREFPGVRIIAISGGGTRTSGAICLHLAEKLGASRTLVKPFNRQELLDAVNALLELK